MLHKKAKLRHSKKTVSDEKLIVHNLQFPVHNFCNSSKSNQLNHGYTIV
jgi:hypothetical protein